MKALVFYDAPIGLLGIAEECGAICGLFFGAHPLEGYAHTETPLLREAKTQLDAYFQRKRRDFDLPLEPRGTEFQRAVWGALRAIPYGEVRSYKEMAALVGNPKASRAVGMANHRNPLAIFIPCHRVIGQDGSLTGYAGGLSVKKFLLELERCHEE